MSITRRGFAGTALAGLTAAGLAHARVGWAQAANPVLRLGVLTDLSGPYRDTAGPGSVAGTQQAAEEAQAAFPGLRVEVVQADHQNKPDVGAAIAREWFDRDGIDAVVDVPNSTVALAVAEVTRRRTRFSWLRARSRRI